jgi:hypothetical protein
MISALAESSSAGAVCANAGRLTPAIIAALANNEARMKDVFLNSELNIMYLPKNGHPLLNQIT